MKATQIVHWPGKDTLACESHAAKLKAVGGIIGCFVSSSLYLGDEECANCVNEAKSSAESKS